MVISIIAVLAGMLMPAVGLVKKAAQGATCQSNLHQFGIAAGTYASDWQGTMLLGDPWGYPNRAEPIDDAGLNNNRWYVALGQRYLAPQSDAAGYTSPEMRTGIYMCPTVKQIYAANNWGSSYGMSVYMTSWGRTAHGNAALPAGQSPVSGSRTAYIAEFDYISANRPRFLWGKTTTENFSGWGAMPMGFPHRERVNILYLDGHVQSASAATSQVASTVNEATSMDAGDAKWNPRVP